MRRFGILASAVLLSTGLAATTVAAVPAQAAVTSQTHSQGYGDEDNDEDNWYWGIFCLLSYCDF